jgi:hypothetical protein
MEDEDVQLFAKINAAERRSLLPAKPAGLMETLAASKDPRLQAMAAKTDDADVPFLLSLLSSGDSAVLEASADALWKLAIGGAAREAIKRANGARPLTALLGHNEPRVVRAAAGAVSILALDASQRTTILASGGAAALSAVLADGADREAEQAARATANLAAEEPTRASLVDQMAAKHLAGVLRRRKCSPGLREAACRALAALATDDADVSQGDGAAAARAASQFAEAGGAAPLIDCLQPGAAAGAPPPAADSSSIAAGMDEGMLLDGHTVTIHSVGARPELNGQRGTVLSFNTGQGRYHVKLNSGETVALRPACVQKLEAAELAAATVDDTTTPLAKAAVKAVRALCVYDRAANELMRLGVLPNLVRLLGSRATDVAASAASALGSLATFANHRASIAASRGVAMLLRCLGEGSDRSVQEPACAALRALALHSGVREQLGRDAHALAPVVAVLSRGDAQAREASAGLLGSIALDVRGREAVLQAGAVQPLVRLLPLRHAPTQEAAARAIKNLAFASDGAAQITKAGGTQPLVRMLKSGSDNLHAAAEAALEVLTMDPQTREQLFDSIQEALPVS